MRFFVPIIFLGLLLLATIAPANAQSRAAMCEANCAQSQKGLLASCTTAPESGTCLAGRSAAYATQCQTGCMATMTDKNIEQQQIMQQMQNAGMLQAPMPPPAVSTAPATRDEEKAMVDSCTQTCRSSFVAQATQCQSPAGNSGPYAANCAQTGDEYLANCQTQCLAGSNVVQFRQRQLLMAQQQATAQEMNNIVENLRQNATKTVASVAGPPAHQAAPTGAVRHNFVAPASRTTPAQGGGHTPTRSDNLYR